MIYRFVNCEVNTSSFEIRRAGEIVSAQPQVLELLIFLLENRARFVSRDEIFTAVWKDRIVSDTTLSGYIKSVRKLVGDDGREQRIIRTVHGRGFQFVARVDCADTDTAAQAPDEWVVPKTRYARSGDVHIAYQVFGNGPVDLVLVPGFISHIENYWTHPAVTAWLRQLGEIARVVMFDKRGTGLSDTVYPLPDFDTRMDDVGAVMDAVSIDSAHIMGISEGGSLATLFAAMHPQRCLGLILYGAFSRFTSWYATAEELQGLFDYIDTAWGSGESLPAFAPSVADDAEVKAWWGRFERMGATPGAAIALMTMNSEIDITEILPSVSAPALVIHRDQDTLIDTDAGRLLAERIPNARYVELSGADHIPWVGDDEDEMITAIAEFIDQNDFYRIPDTTLTTLLAVDLAITATGDEQNGLLDDARMAIDKAIRRFRGTPLNPDGNAQLGSFDGPARAVHCACEILARLGAFAVSPRCCIHTGEVRLQGNRVSGSTVERIGVLTRQAPRDRVILSETVKDLIAGAGLEISPAGAFELESGREMRLFAATRSD